ncbi:MAG: hypothetical protein JNM17_40900 [Archangium sp.]|nr:hypothetical protein [Archangium sp.]
MRTALSVVFALLLGACDDPSSADGGLEGPRCQPIPAVIDFGEVEVGIIARRDFALSVAGDPVVGELREPFTSSFDTLGNFRRLTVTFSPPDARSYLATLFVEPAGCPSSVVELRGSGSGGLVVAHPEVDFGGGVLGEVIQRRLVLTNTRREAIRVDASHVGVWLTIESPSTFTMEPGSSHELLLTGTVRNAGDEFSTLILSTEKSTLFIRTHIVGLAPNIEFANFGFGQLIVPNFGVSQVFSRDINVTNTGAADLHITSIEVIPPGPTLVSTVPPALAPGAMARVTVQFDTAMAPGSYLYNVRFLSDDLAKPSISFPIAIQSQTMDECVPSSLVFVRTQQTPGATFFPITIENQATTPCLLDGFRLNPPRLAGLPEQWLLGAGRGMTFQLGVPPNTVETLSFTPMRIGATPESIAIDNR